MREYRTSRKFCRYAAADQEASGQTKTRRTELSRNPEGEESKRFVAHVVEVYIR